MIIDSHTHLGRNSHITASIDQLLSSMDQAKIDKSLVLAGKMNDADNEWMLEQIRPHTDRLFGVAAAHPMMNGHSRMEEVRNIVEWYKSGLIVGCKFYVGYDHYYPHSDYCRTYLKALNQVGCPVIFHSGDCLNGAHTAKIKYSHPIHIDEVAVDYPNINFIIAHLGFPWVRDTAELCYKNKNVYADLSGFVYGDFDEENSVKFRREVKSFLDIADKSKLLFGTDWPISNQKSYTEQRDFIDLMLEYLSQNAMKAFKLPIKGA